MIVATPARQAAPFIFASPHSGRIYPPSFLRASRLDSLSLRKSEDAFVDELFDNAVELGAPLIAARLPRAFVDPNRAAEELDAAMFEGRLSRSTQTTHVAAGLGVVPRVVREGLEIYRARIPAAEAEFRIAQFHRPYHAALAALVEETRARFGVAVVIDCLFDAVGREGRRHRCRRPARNLRRARTVQSRDRHPPATGFRRGAQRALRRGYTTALHGRPADGVHALQIEVNRALYLHEEKMEKAPSFGDCRELLGHFISALMKADLRWLSPRGALPKAAE